MREIILDTETTGLNPSEGHRVIEIAAIEIIDFLPTGKTFHKYINPERDVPQQSTDIHGLTIDFLSDKKIFRKIADEFLEFGGQQGEFLVAKEGDTITLTPEAGSTFVSIISFELVTATPRLNF